MLCFRQAAPRAYPVPPAQRWALRRAGRARAGAQLSAGWQGGRLAPPSAPGGALLAQRGVDWPVRRFARRD